MACRGVRGATTVAEDSAEAILDGTVELLEAMVAANGLCPEAIASVVFTVTPDLRSAFPASAARALGWTGVPLLDAVEVAVPGALSRCIRVLLHWNTTHAQDEVQHVYLHEARGLRPDLAAPEGRERGERSGREQDGQDGVEVAQGRPSALLGVTRSSGAEEQPRSLRSGVIRGGGDAETGGGGEEMASGDGVEEAARAAQAVRAQPGRSVSVAYQGEPGAYSQEAILQHFGPDTATLPCRSFEEIFAAVDEERVTYGLQPVENSQAGSVHQGYDLLLEHDLSVIGEVKLRVRHCLLAPPGTTAEDIQRVRSHPQALAQCERYLRRRGWQAVLAYDTAGAARELAAQPEPGTAAIASALAAQIYGLEVLETGIEDAADNTTRFFVLGREPSAILSRPAEDLGAGCAVTPGTKTSLVFATAHTPGALYRALGEFASRGLNLTKIESRPRRNRPWHYVFYLDFEGHYADPAVAQALVALLARSAFVKLLGSYPAAE